MSAKAVSEYDGKRLLAYWLPKQEVAAPPGAPAVSLASLKVARVAFDPAIARDAGAWKAHVADQFAQCAAASPWVTTETLVCKPDQLVKRRGKNGLLGIKLDWAGVQAWISERAGKLRQIDRAEGMLHTFVIEPFKAHAAETEHYVCIQSHRDGDEILFTHEGGVEVGDVDAKATRLAIPTTAARPPSVADIVRTLLPGAGLAEAAQQALAAFIARLYGVYVELQFTYLEINPLVYLPDTNEVAILDLAAKVDQTADFEVGRKWAEARADAPLEFPSPFGREMTPEEKYIADLDAKTGASLKLTVLNPAGRIWTMVAGGGASVVYSDAIAVLGFTAELANYGEYSGAPSESQTYEYAKTIMDLMTRGEPLADKAPKFLFIGGGIANFTNVASTFKGVVRALRDFEHALKQHHVKIYVRRAGPNYQEGLKLIRQISEQLSLDMQVYGPEMHVTGIVPLALKGLKGADVPANTAPFRFDPARLPKLAAQAGTSVRPTFSRDTRAFIYGMQPRAVQGMMDFDYMCQRTKPSVACMIYPFGGHHVQKFYWGAKETLVPVYTTIEEACQRFPDVDVAINFASFRSVYSSTKELMDAPQLKTIAIIAEGVPERRTRELNALAKAKGVLIIGPATVGGIKPGCFKIGNTGGMMDNIVASKLYRAGSVAYVSKSGGMSNELNNIISQTTDGVYEGVAIGGDRYPGSTFMDHLLRFEREPDCKILVVLGEVGGTEEYLIRDAVKQGLIKKPIVAWCIGICSTMFTTDVQFGHAGSFANSDRETAAAKNQALREVGVLVPNTFEEMPDLLTAVYKELVSRGTIVPKPEVEAPKIPIDYAWAQELGMIRKPASFITTISDDRGQELVYAGMAISEVFREDIGVGGVLSLLWFKRRLPPYAAKFIEMVMMLTADHGPAVSGAHNTIVTARAGKDLISSLVSGLLTIGDRFGGALDGAAQSFSAAVDKGMSPQEYVDHMRRSHQLILGIGHKIKSRTNPDHRVTIIKDYCKEHFPATPVLNFALAVEHITTAKKDNLILNVDGVVGAAFVDLLRNCGAFSREEADEYIAIGTLNGLFVMGRSIGFIGHYLDQKRLKQGLYRHPWDDISYMMPEQPSVAEARTFVEGKVGVEKGLGKLA
ncbi:hypothetical protein CXG81DRAFT_27237 [Caulochytrium protostelioides]|uniref:ATP-citrate synthase n=1 Tax=Caulochytrium protostelioides TaxID=1555241 RepID=A0A4V1IUC2_9FUNG|nr:ATP-citrate synthase [Caulochytrium protostelioides]RKP00049.1 hypothetical protein CXG81DRAFT_27237 [Caulochytrium protostelioides]|eukprot:RKP00049.1 hypothetical protein CXG81DRAFT_27237 [Caulochytrium protostelioides]